MADSTDFDTHGLCGQNDYLREIFVGYSRKIKAAAPSPESRAKARHIMTDFIKSLENVPEISPKTLGLVLSKFRNEPDFCPDELNVAATSDDPVIQSWGEAILSHVVTASLALHDVEELIDILQEFFIITFACLWRAHLEQ